jgi:hypothetical protein
MFLPLDAEHFAKAINSDQGLVVGPSAEGFVRRTEDPAVIEFSPSITRCVTWIKIPIKMIDKVQPLGKWPCRDHVHDCIILYFKQPESPEAIVFAELLRQFPTWSTGSSDSPPLWKQPWCVRIFKDLGPHGKVQLYHTTIYADNYADAIRQGDDINGKCSPLGGSYPVVTNGAC